MKKIVAFSSIRSDYDLFSKLLLRLHGDKDIELKMLVGGAHLSHAYGYSVEQIRKDGLEILASIESLIHSDSRASRLKSAAVLLQNAVDVIDHYQPDLLLFAGDREEVIIGSLIGAYLQIPSIHIYGGDHIQEPHVDNLARHAATKLSSFHLVSTEEHKARIIKMGESPHRVAVIGNMALDRLLDFNYIPIDSIKAKLNIRSKFDRHALAIYHPTYRASETSYREFQHMLNALLEKKAHVFVSYPNTDPDNSKIIDVINMYEKYDNFYFYKNLDRDIFLSIYKNAQYIIGNSSSGIIESASFNIPAINIGSRQIGRKPNDNVLFSDTGQESIMASIDKALSADFINKVKKVKNIYGDGKSTQRAYDMIKNTDFTDFLYKTDDPLSFG